MKVFGIIGWKNSGKTTLVERLVREFKARGLRVAVVKHSHHGFDIDHEGTDSYRHRAAGADQTLIASSKRWAMITEFNDASEETPLDELLTKLEKIDLVLLEGYKQERWPKLQAVQPEVQLKPMGEDITNIVAIASNKPVESEQLQRNCPVLDLDDIPRIADFITAYEG